MIHDVIVACYENPLYKIKSELNDTYVYKLGQIWKKLSIFGV